MQANSSDLPDWNAWRARWRECVPLDHKRDAAHRAAAFTLSYLGVKPAPLAQVHPWMRIRPGLYLPALALPIGDGETNRVYGAYYQACPTPFMMWRGNWPAATVEGGAEGGFARFGVAGETTALTVNPWCALRFSQVYALPALAVLRGSLRSYPKLPSGIRRIGLIGGDDATPEWCAGAMQHYRAMGYRVEYVQEAAEGGEGGDDRARTVAA